MINRKGRFLTKALLSISLGMFACEQLLACGWNATNDPAQMERAGFTKGKLIYDVNHLPISGRLSKKPWPDTYWPSRFHGIAWRWRGDVVYKGKNFLGLPLKDSRFSYDDIRQMSQEDIDRLSPAEKYDLYQGDYSRWTLYNGEMRRTWNAFAAKMWTGICHGWSPAAIRYKEPHSIRVRNRDGIDILFTSSDIKALLSRWEATHSGSVCQVGGRCGISSITMSDMHGDKNSSINDVNPGSFHILLTNMIGLKDTGFVMDRDPGKEVWNQPVEGFKSTFLEEKSPDKDAAKGTVREFVVNTDVIYTNELENQGGAPSPSDNPQVEAKGEADKVFRKHMNLNYILELDRENKIIGGRWLQVEHPDFVWCSTGTPFSGYEAGIKELYEMATRD